MERSTRADGLTIARQAPPPSVESFAATFIAPAGHAYDPDGKEGLAALTSLLLPSGAGRRDRRVLAREIDRLGGALAVRCEPETIELSIRGPTSALERLLALLADVVFEPRLGASDLERVRRQLFERQRRERTQPDSRAELELFRSIFPQGHPYRESGSGTRSSVERIGPTEVRRFHRDHFTSEGGYLVITAPPSLDRVERLAGQWRGRFARERAPASPSVPPARPARDRRRTIEMPGRSQVEIRYGGSTIARSDERFDAAELANEVLGGRPLLSRLFQRIRERGGLAYHSSSEFEAMRWGGHWLAQAGTGSDRTERVLVLLTAEVERIRNHSVPDRELDRVRESWIGSLPLALDTTTGAHALAVDVVYHGLEGDHMVHWPARLRAIPSRTVRDAAVDAMDTSRSAVVVAGPTQVG